MISVHAIEGERENGKIVASVTIPLYRLHSCTIDVDKPKQVVMFGKEKSSVIFQVNFLAVDFGSPPLCFSLVFIENAVNFCIF